MNRRLAIKMLAAAPLADLAISTPVSAEDEILELDCNALLARIHNGSLRAEHVSARFLQQYEQQRSLNVASWIGASDALSRARDVDRSRDKGDRLPALAGLPILVKDNIDTVGFPTSAGTASLKRYFPRANAPVVDRLLQQGAIIMGKANMPELAFGTSSSNPTFGFVRNPYNRNLIPGGSSGGSAAAIAARIVPAALGTDTAGSVRIPAAFCGVVGFRPSTYPRRQYSPRGIVPCVHDLDTIGPMGRCVGDVAMLHAAIVGERPLDPPLLETVRIGVPKLAYWDDLDPEVGRVAQAALTRLRAEGAALVEIDLRAVKEAAWRIYHTLASRVIPDLLHYLRTHVPSFSMPDFIAQIRSGDTRQALENQQRAVVSDADLLNARGPGRDAVGEAYRAVFRQHGIQAVVFPTEVLLPPPIRTAGDEPGDETIEFNGRMVSELQTIWRNTGPSGVLGVPSLSLPAGLTSSGLPVALEFDGLPGNDNAVLALGRSVEAVIGRVLAPLEVARKLKVSSGRDAYPECCNPAQ